MGKQNEISWPRIAAEGTAIVVSILLAFAIDAWWQRQNEAKQLDALLVSLHEDFKSSQAHVDRWLGGNRKILAALTAFRDQLASTAIDHEFEVPQEWILAAIGTPTYSPTDATLQAAISSGQIELIEDVELRTRLAMWRQQVDDTQEDELLIRQIVVQNLVPALSEQVRLAPAFEFDTIVGWFLDETLPNADEKLRVTATTKLEGAVSERLFYTTFVVAGLADIRQTQADIIQLLENDISGN